MFFLKGAVRSCLGIQIYIWIKGGASQLELYTNWISHPHKLVIETENGWKNHGIVSLHHLSQTRLNFVGMGWAETKLCEWPPRLVWPGLAISIGLLSWKFTINWRPYAWFIANQLVGALEHGFYDFLYIGNVIIPTDELIFFRGRYTTNQMLVLQSIHFQEWNVKSETEENL